MPRWRQDRVTGKLIPIDESAAEADRRAGKSLNRIKGNFDAYKSPVDGSVIRNQKDLDEHNKRNNVVLMDEYGTEHWKKSAKERERFYKGEFTTREKFERKQEINSIIDQVERANRHGHR